MTIGVLNDDLFSFIKNYFWTELETNISSFVGYFRIFDIWYQLRERVQEKPKYEKAKIRVNRELT